MLLTKGITVVLALVIWEMHVGLSVNNISRADFPKDFTFGTSSSAFQFEGAINEDGRGSSVYDEFSHTLGKISDGSNANFAVDQYHLYNEDIELMTEIRMDAYRFSIAWPRIFPNGAGKINLEGVRHYNKVINALLARGIEPYVTLFHGEFPQALEDRYNGWLDEKIIKDFAMYAETCFKLFGDRVKHWMTLNQPHIFIVYGYDSGVLPPGRCSCRCQCKHGNSSTEPYIAARNVLLSHATVADIYRKKYKEKQQGFVGLSFDVMWYEPATSSLQDIEATQRAQDFQLGWFLDPLMFGDYPSSMKSRVGDRLPKFTEAESKLLKGSLDFVGINYYTTYYASALPSSTGRNNVQSDSGAFLSPFVNGKPIGERSPAISSIFIVPSGLRSLVNYIKDNYRNPPVVITENGVNEPNRYHFVPMEDALKDEIRIKYHRDHLTNLLAAIKEDGCNVKGYIVWSLMDNWEWTDGFTQRFGLYFVDFDTLKRYPKDSAKWFKNFLAPSPNMDKQIAAIDSQPNTHTNCTMEKSSCVGCVGTA